MFVECEWREFVRRVLRLARREIAFRCTPFHVNAFLVVLIMPSVRIGGERRLHKSW